MIKIITDSTSDIEVTTKDIEIVPLKVIIDGTAHLDRIDLKAEDFYPMLVNSEALPTTSQPSPQDFLTLFEEAKKDNDEVIVITISSVLSGTYQSACIAKDMVEYDNIYVVDSCSATQALHIIVNKAKALVDAGKSAKEIYDYLETFKHRVHIYAVVDTLEYFYKGGRLSKTSAALGSLLKFKPVVGLKEGKLELFTKARGTQKATVKILDLIKEAGEVDLSEEIIIGYTGEKDGLDKFIETLQQDINFNDYSIGIVGPVIGTHAGPGARLIAYVSK